MSIQSADFAVSVSANDLVSWKGQGAADYVGNPFLIHVFNQLAIAIDPKTLYEKYFELPVVGTGDVYLYRSNFNGESIFAIDMYRDIYDQLDIVTLGVRTKKNLLPVRVALRAFFDSVEYQIHYEEGNILNAVSSLIDVSNYPKVIEQSDYNQQLLVMSQD